jgi:hypothetical protein
VRASRPIDGAAILPSPCSISTEARIDRLAADLAGYFARDNERFDRERFLTACGV